MKRAFSQVPSQTLRDEFKSVFGAALATLASLADAEGRLGSLGGDASQMAAMEAALEDMAKLQEQARRMGFMPEEAALPVSSFSGGWKMRIGLGKILLSDPNLLLLDEPTNHLDLESVRSTSARGRECNCAAFRLCVGPTRAHALRCVEFVFCRCLHGRLNSLLLVARFRTGGVARGVFGAPKHSHGDCEPRPGIPRPRLHQNRRLPGGWSRIHYQAPTRNQKNHRGS
jgi:hypothetical protein